jgi:hypothetical protein
MDLKYSPKVKDCYRFPFFFFRQMKQRLSIQDGRYGSIPICVVSSAHVGRFWSRYVIRK